MSGPGTYCNSCTDTLLIFAPSPEQTNGEGCSRGIMDDIELTCGHHFHWSCFSDAYSEGLRSNCPHCGAAVTDPNTNKLLVTMRNEGGEQRNFDLGTLLDEEEFYDSNPELKRIRAWLEFCAEGEIDLVLDMLAEDPSLLASQDFETGQTGLHVAVQNGHEEMVMLLLEKGADRNAKDNQRRTFLELARELGADEDTMERLRSG